MSLPLAHRRPTREAGPELLVLERLDITELLMVARYKPPRRLAIWPAICGEMFWRHTPWGYSGREEDLVEGEGLTRGERHAGRVGESVCQFSSILSSSVVQLRTKTTGTSVPFRSSSTTRKRCASGATS
jgi:hypothetical protein